MIEDDGGERLDWVVDAGFLSDYGCISVGEQVSTTEPMVLNEG